MTVEVKVPQLPESVADATLVTWHKQPGDPVRRDENLADLETDKVVLEVPCPVDGVMVTQRVAAGATVTAGSLLAEIDEGTAAAAPAEAVTSTARKAAADQPDASGKPSPAAKRLLEENQLAAAQVPGSGKDGRITKGDVARHLSGRTVAAEAPPAPPASLASPAPADSRAPRRVPMTRLRARIAERLVEAQSTQALLTTFNEIDMLALSDLRARYRDAFEKRHGVRLGFLSFFVKACIEGLKRFPVINAAVDGNDIVYHDFYDVGVAVSTDRGLVVPILRNADRLGFAEIEKSVSDFAGRARSGSLTLEELTGGTFSITNGGVFGSLLSTPIANAPQSAILGMHKIQDRPVVVDGQVVVRPMMYVALTYDHRIIDGREAVQFLVAVKNALEDPARLLLEV